MLYDVYPTINLKLKSYKIQKPDDLMYNYLLTRRVSQTSIQDGHTRAQFIDRRLS